MGWWSTALDYAKDAFENDIVKEVTTAAVGAAGSYLMHELIAEDYSIPPVASLESTSGSILKGYEGSEQQTIEKSKEDAMRRKGRGATILTGPQGLVDDEDVEIKRTTLLGG